MNSQEFNVSLGRRIGLLRRELTFPVGLSQTTLSCFFITCMSSVPSKYAIV